MTRRERLRLVCLELDAISPSSGRLFDKPDRRREVAAVVDADLGDHERAKP